MQSSTQFQWSLEKGSLQLITSETFNRTIQLAWKYLRSSDSCFLFSLQTISQHVYSAAAVRFWCLLKGSFDCFCTAHILQTLLQRIFRKHAQRNIFTFYRKSHCLEIHRNQHTLRSLSFMLHITKQFNLVTNKCFQNLKTSLLLEIETCEHIHPPLMKQFHLTWGYFDKFHRNTSRIPYVLMKERINIMNHNKVTTNDNSISKIHTM